MAKEIIFKVRTDTGNTAKDLDKVEKELEQVNAAVTEVGVNYQEQLDAIKKKVDSGTLTQRELTKAVKQYQTIALQAGETSPVGRQAITEAGELSDMLGDLQAQINIAGTDGSNMQAALQLGSTVTAGYGAFQGVLALTGQENEKLTESIMKLQAAQTLLVSIEEIRAALEAESFLMVKANTLAQNLYTAAVGNSTGALKMFRLALIATGIGALVVGIVLLIENWDKLTGALEGTAIAQEALADTMDEYKKGATEASEKTKTVKASFDLAKQGVISKEEALQTYNDTLGDTFGKATNLNEAEKLYNQKTEAYIKATAMRAQAQALLSKAAEESANALSASLEDQTNDTDKFTTALLAGLGMQEEASENFKKGQREGIQEVKKTAQQREAIFNKEAERLLKEAELVENANGIKSESEQKLEETRAKMAEEAQKKREAAAAKRREEQEREAEELQKLQREITDLSIASITDRETRERTALAEKHRRELEDMRAQYGEKALLIDELERKQAMELQALDTELKAEKDAKDAEEAAARKEAENTSRKAELEAKLIQSQDDFIMQDELRRQQAELVRTQSLENEKLTAGEKLKIQAEYDAAIAELDQAKLEREQKTNEAVLTSRIAMAQALSGLAGQVAGIAKEGSAIQKTAALVQIGIDTAVGFVQGLRIAQASAAATGPGAAIAFPLFYAQQVGAVLAAANKAKDILKGGPSISAPTISNSGGGGAGANSPSSAVPFQGLSPNGTTDTSTLNGPQIVLPVDSFTKVNKQMQQTVESATYP